jgi:hypothetical protein
MPGIESAYICAAVLGKRRVGCYNLQVSVIVHVGYRREEMALLAYGYGPAGEFRAIVTSDIHPAIIKAEDHFQATIRVKVRKHRR